MTQGQLFEEPRRWVRIRVEGDPQPKGSWMARVVPRKGGLDLLRELLEGDNSFDWRDIVSCFQAILTPDNKRSKDWEQAVSVAAIKACEPHRDWLPFDRPCKVTMHFWLPRPKKPRFERPAVKPDWDKLVRSTGDAITGIAYVDDARPVSAAVELWYDEGHGTGAMIEVEEV